MRNRIFILLFCVSVKLIGQVSFEQGEYVQFKTAKQGIHVLNGMDLVDAGILANGDRLDRIILLQRTASVLSHLNDTSKEFIVSTPYFIDDSDTILDASSKVYFYSNAAFGVNWNNSSQLYQYTAHPYSNFEHFLVSSTNQSNANGMYSVSGDKAGQGLRTITTSRQFWHRDTAMFNLVGTGRRWFGELFDFTTIQAFELPFNPIAIPDSAIMNIQLNAVARSSVSSTSLAVQGVPCIQFPAVSTSSVAHYVTEGDFNLSFPASKQIILNYDKSSDNGAALWLDQLKVNYLTSNAYVAHPNYQKRFQNFPRNVDSTSTIWINGQGLLVFDVTNANQPVRIEPIANLNYTAWEVTEEAFKEFIAIHPDDAFNPELVRTGKMLDIQALLDKNALIIAPDSLMSSAQRLETIQNAVGVNSKAVSLEEIYAYVNGGTPDIAAIRQFLVELSSHQINRLQYLTLFGDASYDYKETLPSKSNQVPTFESFGSFSLYSSYITDDYFGYLDQGEGLNWYANDLDLGIGRIPVNNNKDAIAVIAKIDSYVNSSNKFGPWRTDVVLVADDVDESWEREFAVVQDALAKRLDTTRPELNLIKIYSDAYLQESKPGSQRYPTAREALYRSVEKGALAVSFVGHGGEVGWASERILQLEDINGWTNRSKLPVFTTITCEFTRFDDPSRVSAGEQLFLNNDGGAIALFSTTRSVFATNSTYDINRLLNQKMVSLEIPRLGDVLRQTKNNNISGDKIKFSLIGDPTIPLSKPNKKVILDSINGASWEDFQDTLNALSWVEIKGHIGDDSSVENEFQGKVWLTFFDKIQNMETRQNDATGSVVNFETQNNIIFRGEATVEKGEFRVQFRIPLDINLRIGTPKVVSYAASQDEDAWGGQRDVLIGGVYDGIISDNQGPDVRLFINDTNFITGGISDSNPLAIGLMKDESGINAVGLGIGHNIVLEMDGDPSNVNDAYISDIDDFTQGSIEYQFYDLEDGEHTLSLRAWDVLNQWGYDEITFVVVNASDPILEQLEVFPNPFTTELHFALKHNQKGEEGTLRLTLSDNQGKLIWEWSQVTMLNGNASDLPSFQISDIPGGKLTTGFYNARVDWKRTLDGKSSRIQEKLIYIR
tara:strand:+ start:2477 stop:5818 length:3342 start_codon:yes stop_codon:yes gene_type:complete